MMLETEDEKRAVEEWERILIDNRPENVLYSVPLTNITVEFLELNIIHRIDYSERYTDEQLEILRTIWARFEANNRQGVIYGAGEIDFSFSEISLIGKILKEVVDAEIGLKGGAGFCRNATNAFLELNGSFVAAGGMDNAELRESFERIKGRVDA